MTTWQIPIDRNDNRSRSRDADGVLLLLSSFDAKKATPNPPWVCPAVIQPSNDNSHHQQQHADLSCLRYKHKETHISTASTHTDTQPAKKVNGTGDSFQPSAPALRPFPKSHPTNRHPSISGILHSCPYRQRVGFWFGVKRGGDFAPSSRATSGQRRKKFKHVWINKTAI